MAESKTYSLLTAPRILFPPPENAPGGECADKPVCKIHRKAHGYQKQEL